MIDVIATGEYITVIVRGFIILGMAMVMLGFWKLFQWLRYRRQTRKEVRVLYEGMEDVEEGACSSPSD